ECEAQPKTERIALIFAIPFETTGIAAIRGIREEDGRAGPLGGEEVEPLTEGADYVPRDIDGDLPEGAGRKAVRVVVDDGKCSGCPHGVLAVACGWCLIVSAACPREQR